jgi:hypothetical protein
MRKIGSCISTTLGFLFFALLLVLFVGPAVYVEVAGKNVPGVVAAKREPINVRYGNWSRQLLIEVRNPSPETTDSGEEAEVRGALIAVLPALYDRLRVGERVDMRYVPAPIPQLNLLNNAGFARLADQPPLGALLATVYPLWGLGVGIGLGLALLAVWSTSHKGWVGLLFGLYVVGAGIYLGSNWPPPEPGGPRAAAMATVRDTHRVTRIWGGRRTQSEEAVQPFDIVELEFVPQDAAGPVIAIDQVDAESAPGLAKGARLPIHYSVEDHRWAQLDTASRTYYWKNLRSLVIVAGLVLLLVGGGWLWARRRKRRAVGKPGFPTSP